MNVTLPPVLAASIETLLEGVSRKDLARRAAALSDTYRGGGTSAGIVNETDALAYVVARLPATYAAVRAVFGRVAERLPDFAPASLLDVGAGPGTASFAAQDAWPVLKAVTLLEHNRVFRQVAQSLMPRAQVMAGDLGADKPRVDMVVAAYVLAELPERVAAGTARDLWAAAAQMLVLVEPGTPQGFARIKSARAALIGEGAHVVAPCTHDAECPMREPDWCHFSQRLQRSRAHMIAKGASVPFEDERYAYVVASRTPVVHAAARIIKPPFEAKPGVTLPLCDGTGLHNQFVPRRDKDAYRLARKLEWGDPSL